MATAVSSETDVVITAMSTAEELPVLLLAGQPQRFTREHWFQVTSASIMQPSVVPSRAGGRAGRGTFTRTSLAADCLAREVPFIEQMTPILRRGAFERVVGARGPRRHRLRA